MISVKAQAWQAARATWKFANRGDTQYACDRRLFKLQMSELRKEWNHEDLNKRREKYLVEREKERALEAQRKLKDHAGVHAARMVALRRRRTQD